MFEGDTQLKIVYIVDKLHIYREDSDPYNSVTELGDIFLTVEEACAHASKYLKDDVRIIKYDLLKKVILKTWDDIPALDHDIINC